MRNLILLVLFFSCAHHEVQKPSWVNAVRSGEETLKVPHGSKTYYRRIAGGPDVSKQTSCQLVIMKAEEDIKKEFPLLPNVPYTTEVLFYDQEYRDCAVTLSVNGDVPSRYEELKKKSEDSVKRREELLSKENVTADEAAELLNMRSDVAMQFALTGLTKTEFEKYSKETVSLIAGSGLCDIFRTNTYSIHGTTHVCWVGESIQGYCTQKDRQCWTRTP